MKIIFFLLALSLLVFPTMTIAQEQPQEQPQQICGKRTDILKALEARYKEIPVAMGLTNNGLMMELFSSPDGSTWTIAMTQTNKTTCLISGGGYLINLIGKPQNKGQDINALVVK